MELLEKFIDFFLHFDKHLDAIIQNYGTWTYLFLFLIVFAETGLVVTPFLPGDSLLFAAGALAGRGSLNVGLVFFLLTIAAVLGDTVNYWIGKYLGHAIIARGKGKIIKKAHLDRTHAYFEKYGGKTIVIARFVPIIRTFAPFVAGLGTMNYSGFLFYNVLGGILWVAVCVGAGYGFGGMQIVRENFSLVVLAIIFLSILPAIIEIWRHRVKARTAAPTASAPVDAADAS